MLGHMHHLAQVLSHFHTHPHSHPCASLLEFTSLTLYFDLSFTILSHFFLLMHLEQHTELDNLITMQKPAHLREQGE